MDQYHVIKDTQEHIDKVGLFLDLIIMELKLRAVNHDKSKLQEDELPYFVEHTEQLKGLTYGSPKYQDALASIKPALDHHYATNRHHPEHFKNGIDDMDLIDVIEMFCDWNASTRRHLDGNINKSIEINTIRFGISQQMVNIFKNSVKYFDGK